MKRSLSVRKCLGATFKLMGVMALTLALGSVQAQAEGSPKKDPAAWSKKMRELEKTLQELLVDLASDARFNAPQNTKRIQKNAEKFAGLAHELQKTDSPDEDPSLPLIAHLFSTEAKHATHALSRGQREYARDSLRSMTGYCIACHTRSGAGPKFPGLELNPGLTGLRPLEQADYFVSIRQFDRALDEYEKILSEPKAVTGRPLDFEKAARSALAISIRVKNDPSRALTVAQRVSEASKAPYFLREQAKAWKRNLEQWKAEPSRQAQTEAGQYAEAVRLITEAKTQQKYPADRSADVLYLRASAVLHEFLAKKPQGEKASEALYLAGLSYEVLQDLGLWDMHEFYYLSCIHKSPHTETARRCFRHYEESLYAGYTGSGGSELPSDVAKKLQELELLSSPLEPVLKEGGGEWR